MLAAVSVIIMHQQHSLPRKSYNSLPPYPIDNPSPRLVQAERYERHAVPRDSAGLQIREIVCAHSRLLSRTLQTSATLMSDAASSSCS
jgi:hypothetical protein